MLRHTPAGAPLTYYLTRVKACSICISAHTQYLISTSYPYLKRLPLNQSNSIHSSLQFPFPSNYRCYIDSIQQYTVRIISDSQKLFMPGFTPTPSSESASRRISLTIWCFHYQMVLQIVLVEQTRSSFIFLSV